QSAFSKMARQQSSLSVETIHRICDALGISMSQFFAESNVYPDLTPQQTQLLHYWNRLNKEKREYALLMIEKLGEL
ncbi:MAG: transcriptional regulator, partial [Lachnospiraceae bacterium]|nr:transcriptional regulator [Lachnospiraceae bacterium]